MKKSSIVALFAAAAISVSLAGCGNPAETETALQENEPVQESVADSEDVPDVDDIKTEEAADEEDVQDQLDRASDTASSEAPEIAGLTYDHAMDLKAAKCFNVYYYNDGFKLIDVPSSGQYLVIPEGKEAPEGLDDEIYKLYQPLDSVYMAATASMSFVDEIGAIDNIAMSSLDKDGWTIEGPVKALENGSMVFAGKYSEPDYEMMIEKGCDLAVESTMIYHTPEVKEMLEDLGIPVFVDRLSYEQDVFGRIEWMKLYGALFNMEDIAEEKFNEQEEILDQLKDFENTGKTVAFFAVNSNKTITVRRTEDFIPNMIDVAGGKYIFDDLKNSGGSTSASIRLSMEEFYSNAVDADYLIYNGTIEAPLSSINDLISKDELFSEFKAVKDGNVWTVDSTWYQSTGRIGYLITDINRMLQGGDPSEMVFLKKVE